MQRQRQGQRRVGQPVVPGHPPTRLSVLGPGRKKGRNDPPADQRDQQRQAQDGGQAVGGKTQPDRHQQKQNRCQRHRQT